jgi:hypothetical protein
MSDWQGAIRGYLRLDDEATGSSLRGLTQRPLQLDVDGVLAAWGLGGALAHTVIRNVRKLPSASDPTDLISSETWSATFEREVCRIACLAPTPALALGGGLDSAAVLAAWQDSGECLPVVLTLATGLADYDEVEQAKAIAASIGAPCEVVSVPPAELVDLLPGGVEATETPLYNLHPLSRLALARVARERGYETLVTGDGADAAFAGRPDLDYVPIVAALTETTGMALVSPFFSRQVIAATLARKTDPEKRPMRDYVRTRGMPDWLYTAPKRSRWMPALDLSRYLTPKALSPLAPWETASLTVPHPDPLPGGEGSVLPPIRLETDRERVGWATLSLLLHSLGGVA